MHFFTTHKSVVNDSPAMLSFSDHSKIAISRLSNDNFSHSDKKMGHGSEVIP